MRLSDRRPPDYSVSCPRCGPGRSEIRNRVRDVLGVWVHSNGWERVYCIRCGYKDRRRSAGYDTIEKAKLPPRKDKRQLARALWLKSTEPLGTPVERYLSNGRGILAEIPPVIRYLPQAGRYAHAMITAFGLQPDIYGVHAVHLTRLSEDGLRKLEKRMFGPVSGKPLALAPIGPDRKLIIVEGIEDALSIHQAMGCGVWAAGSASHLKGLAPSIAAIDCEPVIFADHDGAGLEGANKLARALAAIGANAVVKVFADA